MPLVQKYGGVSMGSTEANQLVMDAVNLKMAIFDIENGKRSEDFDRGLSEIPESIKIQLHLEVKKFMRHDMLREDFLELLRTEYKKLRDKIDSIIQEA